MIDFLDFDSATNTLNRALRASPMEELRRALEAPTTAANAVRAATQNLAEVRNLALFENPAIKAMQHINRVGSVALPDLALSARVTRLLDPSPIRASQGIIQAVVGNAALDLAWTSRLGPPAFLQVIGELEKAARAAEQIAKQHSKSHHGFVICRLAYRHLQANEQREVEEFTVNVLRLPRRLWSYAAEALLSTQWRFELDPIRFVRRQAVKLLATENRAGKSIAAPHIPYEDAEEECASRFEASPDRDLEFIDALQLACSRAGLTGDRAEDSAWLLLARSRGVTRNRASELMGWSPKKVAALWRAISRVQDRIVEQLFRLGVFIKLDFRKP